jgi:hypothetical protein
MLIFSAPRTTRGSSPGAKRVYHPRMRDMTDTDGLIEAVPLIAVDDRGSALVCGLDATARDRRWAQHAARGTGVGIFLEVWLYFGYLNTDFLHRPTWWITLAMIGVVLWWFTGLFNMGRRAVRMRPRMGLAVGRSVELWRELPDVERGLARPVAERLLAAGKRHDVGGVRERIALLERVTEKSAARPYPGWREDIEALTSWEDGAEGVHAD